MEQLQDLLQQQELMRKQQADMQMKVDAIYQALMGSNLLGVESGLVAKVAKLGVENQTLATRLTTMEKELEKYKNMGRGVWLAIGVAAAILVWLVANIQYIKPK